MLVHMNTCTQTATEVAVTSLLLLRYHPTHPPPTWTPLSPRQDCLQQNRQISKIDKSPAKSTTTKKLCRRKGVASLGVPSISYARDQVPGQNCHFSNNCYWSCLCLKGSTKKEIFVYPFSCSLTQHTLTSTYYLTGHVKAEHTVVKWSQSQTAQSLLSNGGEDMKSGNKQINMKLQPCHIL